MRRSFFVMSFVALTACSAGGGGDEPTREEAAAQLEDALLAENITDPDTLPTSGVADYTGYMTARLPTGDGGARTDYLGDLSLAVDFEADTNQVSGQASGFAAGDAVLDGRLQITRGDLFRDTDVDDNFTFTGTVDGTLRDGADRYVIDAEINGEFRGRDQIGVNGLLFGDVEGPDGQDIFDGDFYAAREGSAG